MLLGMSLPEVGDHHPSKRPIPSLSSHGYKLALNFVSRYESQPRKTIAEPSPRRSTIVISSSTTRYFTAKP